MPRLRPLLLALLLPTALVAQDPAAASRGGAGPGTAASRGGAGARSGLRLAAPITTWDEAIPIGNGILGGLLWGGDSTLILSLDRGDLWDERTPAIFSDPDWTWLGMQRLVFSENMTRFHQLFDEPYDKLPYPTKLPAGRVRIIWPGHVVDGFGLDLATATAWASSGKDTLRAWALADREAIVVSAPGDLRFEYQAPAGIAKLGPLGPPSLRRVVSSDGSTSSETATIPTATDSFSVRVSRVGRDKHPLLLVRVFKGTTPPPLPRQQYSLDAEIALHGLGSALKPHRKYWEGVLEDLVGHHPRLRPPGPLRPGQVLLRLRRPPRRAADAVAGSLDRRQRRPAAVEGRLPQRPQHPDDLSRRARGGARRGDGRLARLPLGPAAGVPSLRARLLRGRWRGDSRRDDHLRQADGRLGDVLAQSHQRRLGGVVVLSPVGR